MYIRTFHGMHLQYTNNQIWSINQDIAASTAALSDWNRVTQYIYEAWYSDYKHVGLHDQIPFKT